MFNFFNYTSLSKLTYFLPPELLHQFFLQAFKFNIFKKKKRFENLETKVLGKHYNNPIGLAAGFDKNAEVINGSFNLNFGFVEVELFLKHYQLSILMQDEPLRQHHHIQVLAV